MLTQNSGFISWIHIPVIFPIHLTSLTAEFSLTNLWKYWYSRQRYKIALVSIKSGDLPVLVNELVRFWVKINIFLTILLVSSLDQCSWIYYNCLMNLRIQQSSFSTLFQCEFFKQKKILSRKFFIIFDTILKINRHKKYNICNQVCL